MKKIILSFLVLGIVFLAGCGQQQINQDLSAAPASTVQPAAVSQQAETSQKLAETKPPFDKKALEAAAYDAVNARTKGVWDKKIEIGTIHESQKAAKGFWWAQDRWDWIAWQKDDGAWTVLVSADGFNCKELDQVPSQYAGFFNDLIYNTFGNKDYPHKKYCY